MENDTSDTQVILGLDLGTSSVGWAFADLRACGTRIFPEGMDRTKGEKSLNQDRREARSLRRQTYRRVRRKTMLLNALIDAGLLPKDDEAREALFRTENPYELRARALTEKLEPWQVGRALYHLGQRRGYLSNRKTGNDKEDGKVGTGIGELAEAIQAGGHKTLGQYFASLDPHERRIREHYTARRMYFDEFEAIWSAQASHHPKQMSSGIRPRIQKAIFDQRPLKIQKYLVGGCEFEPGRKRAARATLAAQEFRLWSNLNHLKILHSDTTEDWLTDEQRATLHDALATTKQISWDKVRKLLGLLESNHFNLEKVRKSGLLGNQTAALVASAIGKKEWKALGEKAQEQLVFDLININSDEALITRLHKHWRSSEEQTQKLIKKSGELPKGYLHLSHLAARKITAELKRMATKDDRGLTYDQACAQAGYEHTKSQEARDYSVLPFPGKVAANKRRQHQHDKETLSNLVTVDGLRNPMVERALYQVRRVVNAIIHKYGKPDIIRVEMARDLKANSKQRENFIRQQRQNEKDNETAEKALREYGINPSRADKLKYRLWVECGHTCSYTGKQISFDALFGEHPQFDIEHIIPYTRSLDDSYMNKTLCDRDENTKKGNFTPWEFYQGDENKYAEVLQRARKLPWPKFRRFAKDAMKGKDGKDKDFVTQQLNETRYISRKAVEYLTQLGIKIEPVKGGTTALLRRAWGLNNILGKGGEKTRADHRHHAVDALVCALTDRSAVQKLNRYAALSNGQLRIEGYPEPIKDLRKKAEAAIAAIKVSHKTSRKLKGPLHEETLYGPRARQDEKGNALVSARKSLTSLKPKDMDMIADKTIAEMAKRHLDAHGGDIKKAFGQEPTSFGFDVNKNGVERFIPIQKVRIEFPLNVKAIGQGKRQRFVKTGANHHMEIFELVDKKGKPKWIGHVVSVLEATLRKNDGKPIVDKQGKEGQRFIMALHINDAIEMTHEGQCGLYVVQKMAQSGQIHFRAHHDASERADMTLAVSKKPDTLRKSDVTKVSVNPLGEVMPADE